MPTCWCDVQAPDQAGAAPPDAIQQMEELGSGFYLAMHDGNPRRRRSARRQPVGRDDGNRLPAVFGHAQRSRALAQGGQGAGPAAAASTTTDQPARAGPAGRLLRRRARAPVVYKRLANCATQEKIDDIQEELIDRFGKLPDAVKALVETHRLRIAAKTVGIIKIDAHTEAANLQFMAKPPIDPMRIIGLIQKNRQIKLHGQDKLKITAAMPDLAARVTQIKTTIKQLTV
jgi:transcription-repair coupling factor (superfamily II helicase)